MNLRTIKNALSQEEITLKQALRGSLIAHGVILLFLLIKGWLFPGSQTRYLPSLRVDLVALPDVLKKDLESLKNLPTPADLKTHSQANTAPKEEKASSEDEMILNAKKKKTLDTAKDRGSKTARDRARKAIQRIKALSQVEESAEEAPQTAVVKGNRVSHGGSLSADARETAEKSYYDDVLLKLQDNWALPVWLSRQDLSAQVMVLIDARGGVAALRFTKSSGNAQFDDAVKRAIAASQPFPRPPEELRDSLMDRGLLLGFPL
jgi:TonB family protein